MYSDIPAAKMSGPSRELNPGPPPTGAYDHFLFLDKPGSGDNPKKESYY